MNILLEREINLVKDEDDSSNTPLHLAALEGHVAVVESLLNYGADVGARFALFHQFLYYLLSLPFLHLMVLICFNSYHLYQICVL